MKNKKQRLIRGIGGGNLGEEMHASGFTPSRKCKSNVVGQSSGEGTGLTFEKGKTQLGMDIQAIHCPCAPPLSPTTR